MRTTNPDKKKVRSILKMAVATREMLRGIDHNKFPTNVTKEYYEIVRELLMALLLLDGLKTYSEGAHKMLIEYAQATKEFSRKEIGLMEELRTLRNRISYDGFFVEKEYLERKEQSIEKLLDKLEAIIKKRLASN